MRTLESFRLENYYDLKVLFFVMTNLISSDCKDYRQVGQPGEVDMKKRLKQQQNSSAALYHNDPTRVITLQLS